MKIIFFGLGSIGQRHARLLRGNSQHELFAFRRKITPQGNNLGIKEVYSWKEVEGIAPEVAFITNPTHLHISTALRCARLGMHLFIEKPIGCDLKGLDGLIDIVAKKKLTAYVAYCLRFHPVIEKIKRYSAGKDCMHALVISSSYLPEWRPGRDYAKVYSASGDKGGGAILDLSHEMDYSTYLFGEALGMQGAYGRLSNLRIDAEDYADIIMQCRRAVVNIHLDFFSRHEERRIRLDFRNSDYLEADLIDNCLETYFNRRRHTFRCDIERDGLYLRQLDYFFRNIGNPDLMNNLKEASGLFKAIIKFKRGYGKQRGYTRRHSR